MKTHQGRWRIFHNIMDKGLGQVIKSRTFAIHFCTNNVFGYMPVKLRLRRQGRSKNPHYAIVVADSRTPRDGAFIEKIGTYNPITHPAQVYIDHNAALKWLGVGAQPTNTVLSLLRHTGVTVKFALSKQGKSEEEADLIFSRWRADKDAKKKKKMISVDVHGRPLEPVPDAPGKFVKKVVAAAPVAEAAAAPQAEEVAPESVEAVAPAVVVAEEVAPVAEPVAEETSAPEAEAAPEVEAAPEASEEEKPAES